MKTELPSCAVMTWLLLKEEGLGCLQVVVRMAQEAGGCLSRGCQLYSRSGLAEDMQPRMWYSFSQRGHYILFTCYSDLLYKFFNCDSLFAVEPVKLVRECTCCILNNIVVPIYGNKI